MGSRYIQTSSLRLTPLGRLVFEQVEEGPALDPALGERLGEAFARGSGHGLLRLGGEGIGHVLPPIFAWWRELGAHFLTALCTGNAGGEQLSLPPFPPEPELQALAGSSPLMTGGEYITVSTLQALWVETAEAFTTQLGEAKTGLQAFLKTLNPAWNLVGRVHFNLAENRRDEAAPFAFLATYTSRLSAHGKAQHLPLGQALSEYAGGAKKERLLSLLLPVQRAAEHCPWLKELVDTGDVFHPLRWSVNDAVRFLGDVPALEQAGVVVRMPTHWRAGRPARAQVTGSVGARAPAGLGKEALLDFEVSVTLDGEPVTPQELEALLASSSGLALIRGQWVEVDRERTENALRQFKEAERLAREGGLTFAEAMRLLAGAAITGSAIETADVNWSRVMAGPWLAETLKRLRSPEGLAKAMPGHELRGELRPYQQVGVQWLNLLSQLGLGACLADDMGLGKTIQVLSLLLVQRQLAAKRPSLLVVPTSLLANWTTEIEKFTPGLSVLLAHPSAMPGAKLKALFEDELGAKDLVITSYGTLLRLPWLEKVSWHLVILDEAQAIKNPGAKQTQAAKRLKARARIALTGTPIENRLMDLWSMFDFINPGLLGSEKEFSGYAKRLAAASGYPYGPLRDLVRPYILRRLKTDKAVIADLPEKTEMKAFCPLSKKQAALYQESVDELRRELQGIDGIKRRGVVLAFLMRFKQICNHPSQWLGDALWEEADGGKWGRLREIAEVIASKQEKVLVFTQFREVTEPLAAFLAGVFGRSGLVLHGETPVAKRKVLVQRFQEDESVPFLVLSLKAGGVGLNLTAASHVVHFDRWWNPAVENQATDRAFRIGQKKNVLVHKFVCKGTVEEKIDVLIEAKKQLSQNLIEGGADATLTELDDEALLDFVKLDLNVAMKE
ncbi:MAG: DEAD/DEAH box helicase [Myxococcaceae bacterium]|nr:DEAD/DEAH box helicase [Myxococcaceae bacterium]